MLNDLFYLNLEVIINRHLYEKNIISENIFWLANEKLLKKIAELT